MPGKRIICKQCGSFQFKQISVSEWQCLNCGKIRRNSRHISISKRRHEIPKENITTSKNFNPLAVYCKNCGEKIDRIGHPNDQKRLNNKWANHTCIIDKKIDNFYQ